MREPLSEPGRPLQNFYNGLHLHPHPPLIKSAFFKHQHFQNSPFQFCYPPVLFDYEYENTHTFIGFSLKMSNNASTPLCVVGQGEAVLSS